MYHRLPGSAADGEYNRVASLWFCAMVALFQSGNNALTIAYGQKALLRREAQVNPDCNAETLGLLAQPHEGAASSSRPGNTTPPRGLRLVR